MEELEANEQLLNIKEALRNKLDLSSPALTELGWDTDEEGTDIITMSVALAKSEEGRMTTYAFLQELVNISPETIITELSGDIQERLIGEDEQA